MDLKEKYKKAFYVTAIGAVANSILSIVKILIGLFSYSHSVLADGIHSLSDLFTDAIVVIFLKISYKPATRDKPYGNRKLESIASLFISLILILVVAGMIYRVIDSPVESEIQTSLALVVLVFSIIIKEILYRYTIAEGKKLRSSTLIANAWHQRTDSLSSLLVLFCLIMGTIFGNTRLWDMMGVGMVGIMILHAVWKIIKEAFKELLDYNPSKELLEKIELLADDIKEITFIHNVRIRSVGGAYHISFSVEMNGTNRIDYAHKIIENLKERIKKEISNILSMTVQISPTGTFANRISKYGIDKVDNEEFF
jgi:cation diffusion facilitator family transporter